MAGCHQAVVLVYAQQHHHVILSFIQFESAIPYTVSRQIKHCLIKLQSFLEKTNDSI